MSEPVTLWQIFYMYRHELGFSFIAALVAVFRHWQMRHPFRDIVTSGILCASFAFGITTALEFFGLDGNKWGYLASVFLGYVGVESMLDALSEKLPFLGRTARGKEEAAAEAAAVAPLAPVTTKEDQTNGKI